MSTLATNRHAPLLVKLLWALAGVATVSLTSGSSPALGQVAVQGETVYTMAGPAIRNGVVLIRDGKVAAVGKAADIRVPDGFRVLNAKIVTPGLIDAHTVVGLSGYYNSKHDQEQLESSTPIQPELRALDAYNPREKLVEWLRGFGITTIQTGHAPGELISGQMMVVKTIGDTPEDTLLVPTAAVAVTLGESAKKRGAKSPGSRAKMMALLRARLIAAGEYARKRAAAEEEKRPARDLGLEILTQVLNREVPLLVTANRAQDIANALRLAREFSFRWILDGASEAYLLVDQIRAAGVPVVLHPPMARPTGEMENSSFETAAKLRDAKIPFAFQSGYESYVPKTRVVLFEAALAASNGLSFREALAAITVDAARIIGVDDRVGSLAVGKDGDVALYDGDPFEYTTHCIGVVINGKIVSEVRR